MCYPVYKLSDILPHKYNGVVWYSFTNKDKDTGEFVEYSRVLDDTKIPENTLARRRLRLLASDTKLYTLRNAIFFPGDLIKASKGKTYFIDAKGQIFKYIKQVFGKLTFHKIKKVIPIASGGAVLELDGVHGRFKTLHCPTLEEKYASILSNKNIRILYGIYTELYDNTRRKL